MLDNDVDIDGDRLTVTRVSAANGSVIINVDGSLTYTPYPNFNGIDTIVYYISDSNGGVATVTVIVTVEPLIGNPLADPNTNPHPGSSVSPASQLILPIVSPKISDPNQTILEADPGSAAELTGIKHGLFKAKFPTFPAAVEILLPVVEKRGLGNSIFSSSLIGMKRRSV